MNSKGHVTPQLIIGPAYGRSYASVEALSKDWHAGKDFKVVNGPYCSIRDISEFEPIFLLGDKYLALHEVC